MSFVWFLSPRQMSGLSEIRAEFLALPRSGLTISQVQGKCEDLVDKVTAILQSGSGGRPDYTSAARHFWPAAGRSSGCTAISGLTGIEPDEVTAPDLPRHCADSDREADVPARAAPRPGRGAASRGGQGPNLWLAAAAGT